MCRNDRKKWWENEDLRKSSVIIWQEIWTLHTKVLPPTGSSQSGQVTVDHVPGICISFENCIYFSVKIRPQFTPGGVTTHPPNVCAPEIKKEISERPARTHFWISDDFLSLVVSFQIKMFTCPLPMCNKTGQMNPLSLYHLLHYCQGITVEQMYVQIYLIL